MKHLLGDDWFLWLFSGRPWNSRPSWAARASRMGKHGSQGWYDAMLKFFVLFCDAGGQTLISQMPHDLHQLLIYIGAASGEIKHANKVTNHTLLPTGLGRILMGWKFHLQLNFMRLHLEIEQSYQAGKLVKWCISSACICPVPKIFFCDGRYVKCEFYVCNFCSIKLNQIDFVIKTIRKEIWKQKVNSINNQHATSEQFFSLHWSDL